METSVEQRLRALKVSIPMVVARALNKSIISARTQLVRDTAADMKLKVGDVRDRTAIREATSNQPVAKVMASAKPLPAILFNAKGPEPSRGKGRGVRANLPGSPYPHAFIATVGTGHHRGVFMRKGKGRLPIRELHGPSVAHVSRKYAAAALARGREQLVKNLQHELIFAMRTGR